MADHWAPDLVQLGSSQHFNALLEGLLPGVQLDRLDACGQTSCSETTPSAQFRQPTSDPQRPLQAGAQARPLASNRHDSVNHDSDAAHAS